MSERLDPARTVAFIGAGVMGEAIISGLLASGHPAGSVLVGAHRPERDEELRDRYGLKVLPAKEAVAAADLVVLAVKPDKIDAVLAEFGDSMRPPAVLISVAAGITTASLRKRLASGIGVVRAMPNTPVLVGEGMTLLSADEGTEPGQLDNADELMGACGQVLRISESKMDAATAVSGSGPAYLFYVVDAMIEAGVLLGLPRTTATELAVQTIVGAGALLRETGEHPVVLRERVSSPGGTTITALAELDRGGVRASFVEAMKACAERSAHLAADKD